MMTYQEIVDLGITELNAFVVFTTIISWAVTLFTTVLWQTAKRKEKKLRSAKENYVAELESKQSDLEQDLQYQREQTAKYWLDKASKGISVEEGLAQEYRPDILQDGMQNLGPSMHKLFLQSGLMRFQVFLATEEEFEIQEAERLLRIAHLMKPDDRLTKKRLDEVAEVMAADQIERGKYNPDDPRLMDSSLDKVTNIATSKEEIVNFLLSKGKDFYEKGHLWTSERLLNRARIIAINALGRQDLLTLEARRWYLFLAIRLGLYSYYQKSIETLIKDCEDVFKRDNPILLAVRYLKIEILQYLGKHDDALIAVDELLPVQERVTGKEHPDTLGSYYLRIQILNNLGKHDDALIAVDNLLSVIEKVTEKDHPNTLATRSLKTQILHDLGKYNDALIAVDELLPTQERVKGKEHPSTLRTHHLKIKILNSLGKYDDALIAVDGLLPVQERVTGKEHPDTLSGYYLRIQILNNLGKHDDALIAVDELLPVQERVTEKDHPNTLLIRSLKTRILHDLGKYNDALIAVDELLPIQEQVKGKEHPHPLLTLKLKIQILHGLGKYDEALSAVDELLPVVERVIGKEHPNTLLTRELRDKILESQNKSDNQKTDFEKQEQF